MPLEHVTAPRQPTVFIDANPLSERHLTGIGRYTARVALALADQAADVRFFSFQRELVPPSGLSWDQDEDLSAWGRGLWRGRLKPLTGVPSDALGLYTCLRPAERSFPFEVSILHDFTPLIVPQTHSDQTRRDFQFFFGRGLLASDAAVAVSHSTKADAGWLSAFDPLRIAVAHSGPSLCVRRHLRGSRPVRRRPEVGLVVSTLEPRKNADFLLDWFRQTEVLPADAELWWVGSMGWLMSQKALRAAIKRSRRKVRLLGIVPDAKLCELYATAGWTVYPSLYEGFGFPVLDALRHGAPVLAGYHSSLREFRSEGLEFFDPRDPSTLDSAWRAMRSSDSAPIPIEALDHHFDWGRVARTILNPPAHVAAGHGSNDRRVDRAA